jgi:hypothetical protein
MGTPDSQVASGIHYPAKKMKTGFLFYGFRSKVRINDEARPAE